MKKIFQIALPLAQFILLILSVIGIFSKNFYLADIFAHFNVQYAALSLFLTTVFIWRRVWLKWIILSSVVVFINFLPVAQLYFNKQSTISIDQSFKLITFNVLDDNSDKPAVMGYLLNENPDVLVLNEYTPEWDMQADTLKQVYEYYDVIPLHGHFGIAVFSRLPCTFERKYYAMNAVPSIKSTFYFEGDSIQMLATHPTPPVTPFDWEARNYQLDQIAKERIKSLNKNYMIVGDLNITSFSKPFKDLTEITFTRDSRLGFGLQPTWPSWNKLFYISLDHCLVSENIVVKNRELGPFLGSDHVPVELELSLKKKL